MPTEPAQPQPPTDPPRVTAIIIFLNGVEYLAEAVESVRAQSFGDWSC